jgi:peptide/nickel transport system substrate-binding protein
MGFDKPPSGRVEELTTRHTGQTHLYPYTGQFAMYLNTRVPPFDDPRVCRALSYAVDRRAVQKRYPGPAQITCQYLPPNFPGYQPYCPYTLNPDPAGAWTAADRATATRLIKQSGTKGMQVTVWSLTAFADVSRYYVKLLDSLGYQPRLRTFADINKFFGFVSDSRNKAQMAAYWFIGAQSPSELTVGLRCRSFVPNTADNDNPNTAEFCSRELDGRIERALRLQATDPAKAGPAWAAVDRQIVDQAPAIPLLVPEGIDLVSTRVGNYQHNPHWGIILSRDPPCPFVWLGFVAVRSWMEFETLAWQVPSRRGRRCRVLDGQRRAGPWYAARAAASPSGLCSTVAAGVRWGTAGSVAGPARAGTRAPRASGGAGAGAACGPSG